MTKTAWITVSIVGVTILALIAVASFLVSRFDGQKSPELSAVSCHWAGGRVIMSGVVHNPSSSSQVVIVNPTFRFTHGNLQNLGVTLNNREFTSVAAGATFHWSADVTPADVKAHLGQRIVSCDPTSPNASIDEQDNANDG
jgi:hypothetical protein